MISANLIVSLNGLCSSSKWCGTIQRLKEEWQLRLRGNDLLLIEALQKFNLTWICDDDDSDDVDNNEDDDGDDDGDDNDDNAGEIKSSLRMTDNKPCSG